MSIAVIEDRIRDVLPNIGALRAVVKFDLKGEGILRIDATQTPAVISREDGPADTTIIITAANLEKLMDGKMDAMVAFALGKIKVDGSKGLAAKLTGLLT
ncbi:SCP2 sterol-binding domain-containing protein [Novispirillum itersonii]|uniref:SCP2 sterol-binding domain-containing protein n=1 Tax=Novispirillum itersonii TaxID=189 RepID=UPI0003711EB3|nr:SCP2 sterol-binding domain-containing protein [Novispirillum itersonii]